MIGEPFTDARGTITDLLEEIDSVTQITTAKDAVRGNHVHYHTTQWTYVVFGWLRIICGGKEIDLQAGQMVKHAPGDPHAWIALEDTTCLVFTRGPRSGDQYESDTHRLDEPMIA